MMSKLLLLLVSLGLLALWVRADTYMHNPRGSNGRNCERNDNRNSDTRLMNTQNNGAGGYACPRAVGGPETVTPTMYYYVGSRLPIMWTSQHSCGKDNAHCQVVLQYMCSKDVTGGIRDGTPTSQTDAATNQITTATESDLSRGRHEPLEYFLKCRTRTRNLGLYIADKNLDVNANAQVTRQNNNGQEYGFECQEERDYYPYFHPTPWKDIAVITSNTSQCDYYKANSQNVVDKGECLSVKDGSYLKYNNENQCLSNNGKWNMRGKWNLPAPDCVSAATIMSQDNHLGNAITGSFATYLWTIPDDVDSSCVLRLRYNISTAETPFSIDSKSNGANSPIYQDIMINTNNYNYPSELALALNTNQYGRTFQDRSYVFEIRKRPDTIPWYVPIHNLNVAGKRGNIVDVYPSIEYQFVPNVLVANGGDYIHIQWTGSDYNPNRNPNSAEGGPLDPADGASARADRSNLVQMDTVNGNIPRSFNRHTMFMNERGAADMEFITKLAYINQPITDTTQCYTQKQLEDLGQNSDQAQKDSRNCGKLNAAKTPYFDAGVFQLKTTGSFSYMSTRNNNFSNRSQKGNLIVYNGWFSSASTHSIQVIVIALSVIVSVLFM